jgi:molybdenum cofactor cytidylyltransferase
MGRLKQLLPWDGEPLIGWQVRQLREGGVDIVIAVLGHASREIEAVVPDFASTVVNDEYKQGRATSLKRGAKALKGDTEAVLVLSVDQPRPAWLARRLIERWRIDQPLIVSPRFAKGFGHPILLDGSLVQELREVDEATLGLRAVIDRHLDRAVSLVIANNTINVDLNTPADYETAKNAYESGRWQEI